MDGMNFFGAAQAMMNRLMVSLLQGFQDLMPMGVMLNAIWAFVGGFFVWHFLEALYMAYTKGTALGIFHAFWDLVRKRWLRVVIYAVLAVASLYLVNGGFQTRAMLAPSAGAWTNIETQGGTSDLATDTGGFMAEWLGNNIVVNSTDANGATTQVFQKEAPVIKTLKAATESATQAVNALSASDVHDRINEEIQRALDERSRAVYGTAMPTYLQPGVGDGLALAAGANLIWMPVVDGLLNCFNWFTFVWAQWTLTRTLALQALFLQLSWHLGLYFLPIFILLAYFRSMQGFLTNLLKNYFAMMVAGFIMASVALILFDANTWIGASTDGGKTWNGGIIQLAFKGLTIGVNDAGGYDPGSFPWVMRTYARQVAKCQIVWILGACGIILGQIYEIVRGVLDGGFRAHFQGGSASRSAVFGGK